MALITHADTGAEIAGISGSFNHTQAAGSNKFLFLVIDWQNTQTLNALTYGGIPLVLVTSGDAGFNRNRAIYVLTNPPDGLNAVSFTLSANPVYATFIWVCSFTNCSGIVGSQRVVQAPMVDPALYTFPLAITSGSIVLAGGLGIAYTGGMDVEIPNGTDGTSLDSRIMIGVGAIEIEKNTNNPISGTVELEISAPLANPLISLWGAEIGEFVTPPPSSKRRCIIT